MYPIPGRCPVCGETMEVTRLHCRHCDTAVEGHFTAARLSRLNAEQLNFVETFLRCEGTIKRVEKELGISYPTVRARLEEVIHTLGWEVVSSYGADQDTLAEAERAAVLERLERGEITSEEALGILHSGR